MTDSTTELLKAAEALIASMINGPEHILREDEIKAIINARKAIARAEGK